MPDDPEFIRPEGVGRHEEPIEPTPGEPYPDYGRLESPANVPREFPAFKVGDLLVVRDPELIPDEAETRGTEFSDWEGIEAYLDSGPGRTGLANGLFIIREVWYEDSEEPYYEVYVFYTEEIT